jgi:hypothetical protein
MCSDRLVNNLCKCPISAIFRRFFKKNCWWWRWRRSLALGMLHDGRPKQVHCWAAVYISVLGGGTTPPRSRVDASVGRFYLLTRSCVARRRHVFCTSDFIPPTCVRDLSRKEEFPPFSWFPPFSRFPPFSPKCDFPTIFEVFEEKSTMSKFSAV